MYTVDSIPHLHKRENRTWKILKRQRSRKETAVLRCMVSVRPEVGRFSSSTSYLGLILVEMVVMVEMDGVGLVIRSGFRGGGLFGYTQGWGGLG